jgi:hypothetical protein
VEFLVEILLQVVGEFVIEALFEASGRTSKAIGREVTGTAEPSVAWRAIGFALVVAAGVGFGLWRGSESDGGLTWGWWTAVVIAAACLLAMLRGSTESTEPPAGRWQRALTWWPPRRLSWFLAGNAAFAIAYLVGR